MVAIPTLKRGANDHGAYGARGSQARSAVEQGAFGRWKVNTTGLRSGVLFAAMVAVIAAGCASLDAQSLRARSKKRTPMPQVKKWIK
jgi:hypothetical protein